MTTVLLLVAGYVLVLWIAALVFHVPGPLMLAVGVVFVVSTRIGIGFYDTLFIVGVMLLCWTPRRTRYPLR